MICYKDMTFCDIYETCQNGKECDLALTADVAMRSMEDDLPVSVFVGKPDCWVELV